MFRASPSKTMAPVTAPFMAPHIRSQVIGRTRVQDRLLVIPETTSRARPKPVSTGCDLMMRSTAMALAAIFSARAVSAQVIERPDDFGFAATGRHPVDMSDRHTLRSRSSRNREIPTLITLSSEKTDFLSFISLPFCNKTTSQESRIRAATGVCDARINQLF